MSKDGGPAFPFVDNPGGAHNQQGMSLRDWFAGQALTALFTSQYVCNNATGYAKDAYDLADAMLAAREQS